MPLPAALPPCPDLTVHRLRAHAETLRREADAIDSELRAVPAFDRPDVWQGGRATAFPAGLDDQTRRLSTPGAGVTDALRAAASRIEHRADALQAEARAATLPASRAD